MEAKTQSDIVEQDLGVSPQEVISKVVIPGIEQLHTKSMEDIAKALAMVLKSQPNVTRLNYVIGKYIELTSEKG